MTNRLMYFRKAVLRASASAIVVSTGLVPMTAHAQDAAASEPQAEEQRAGGLGEIIVTARKRSENLQETPVAITAMNAEMLEAREVNNVAQVAKFAPNVNMSPVANISGSSATITAFIRGVGQTDFNITVDTGVGIYVDGVYVARSVGALLDMTDIADVQILRGPQGTLFGKNTIGGAIVVNSVQPQHEFDLKLEAATGRFNRADFKGMINVPLSDNLAMRAVASYETRDGYQKRLFDGGRQGNKDSFGGRIAFKWEPTDKLTVSLSGDINIRREEQTAISLLELQDQNVPLRFVDIPNSATTPGGPQPPDRCAQLDVFLEQDPRHRWQLWSTLGRVWRSGYPCADRQPGLRQHPLDHWRHRHHLGWRRQPVGLRSMGHEPHPRLRFRRFQPEVDFGLPRPEFAHGIRFRRHSAYDPADRKRYRCVAGLAGTAVYRKPDGWPGEVRSGRLLSQGKGH